MYKKEINNKFKSVRLLRVSLIFKNPIIMNGKNALNWYWYATFYTLLESASAIFNEFYIST